MQILWFLLAGAGAGLCAGLFGVGGGLIIVPVLMAIFSAYHYPSEVIAHLAVGTSLATIVITSMSSLLAHNNNGAVYWQVWRILSIGLIVGALLGAFVAKQLHSALLTLLIASMAVIVGVKMVVSSSAHTKNTALPKKHVQVMAGLMIGFCSAVFGIGGGSLTVPLLSRFGLDIKRAVGTSAACGLPIALSGAAGFMLFGQNVGNLPSGTIGFVHVLAFICISSASFIFAKLGAFFAHRLPAKALKSAFGILLIIVGVHMMFNVF